MPAMFIGHYAVAFAAKKAAPKVSLGTLFLATQFLDLLWPIFLLLGLEHVRIAPGNTAFTPLDFYDYPISHSLLTVAGWSAAFGLVYYALRRYAVGAWVLGLGVLSHWILDLITHRPDLPLAPGTQTFWGLGLWQSVAATVLVESALFTAAVALYARTTRPRDRIGSYAFWGLVIFCVLGYAGNVMGRESPPPDANALAVFGLTQWLILPWTYWIDRHRRLATDTAPPKD